MGVLQLFDSFYCSAKKGAPLRDVYWTPVPQIEEVPRVLDVKRSDPHSHDSADFEVSSIGKQHFTERAERLPLKLLNLAATEEALSRRPRSDLLLFCFRPACQTRQHCLTSKSEWRVEYPRIAICLRHFTRLQHPRTAARSCQRLLREFGLYGIRI